MLIAALAAALAGGAGWRLASGRMRVISGSGAAGQAIAGQASTGQASTGQASTGQAAAGQPGGGSAGGRERVTAGQIGHQLGERATLLQFSSAFCAPCRATRRILADVAQLTPGVAHIEIDAESRLDLVRQLNVLRTPTVLVLDAGGGVVRRASGQPRKPDVIAAIGAAVGLGLCPLSA